MSNWNQAATCTASQYFADLINGTSKNDFLNNISVNQLDTMPSLQMRVCINWLTGSSPWTIRHRPSGCCQVHQT